MTADHVGTAAVDVAVLAWWAAWESKDLDRVLALALPEYLEFTGHSETHRLGRDHLASVATRAFAAFTIRSWELGPRTVRRYGDVAVVGYRWRSMVETNSSVAAVGGVATDVLANLADSWRYAAHHSSTLAGPSPAPTGS